MAMSRGEAARKRTSRPPRERFLVFGAPAMGEAEIGEVVDSMRSGWLGTGPKVARFEELFRDYTGARHAVAVNSCTAALHLSLLASGVGPGDEVVTTPMTFVATANAIVHTGATPVFVDCDARTGLIDPQRIEDALTPRTRAILPVHLHGRPCDMKAILEIARRRDLVVIDDAAHAIEAQVDGEKIGTLGDLTCFSFYVTKNMTTGEGGMITTSRSELADLLKVYALHGMSRDAWKRFSDEGYRHYQVVVPGFKYNMMDLQAAIGLHQLPRLEEWQRRRRGIWNRYQEAFADLPVERPAPEEPGTVHAHHLYTLRVDAAESGISRDAFMQRLFERNIGTGVHYLGVHLHAYYRDRFGFAPSDFPNASRISDGTVSLPLSGSLQDDDVEDVIAAVRDVLTLDS